MSLKGLMVLCATFGCSLCSAQGSVPTDTIPFVSYKTRIVYSGIPTLTSGMSREGNLFGGVVDSAINSGVIKNEMSAPLTGGSTTVEQETTTNEVPVKDVQM